MKNLERDADFGGHEFCFFSAWSLLPKVKKPALDEQWSLELNQVFHYNMVPVIWRIPTASPATPHVHDVVFLMIKAAESSAMFFFLCEVRFSTE